MSNPFPFQGDTNSPSYHKPHLLQHADSLGYSASGREAEEEFDSICNEQTFGDQAKGFSYPSFPSLDEQLQNSNKSFLNFCHHGEPDKICVDNHITASSVYQAYRNRQTYRSSDEELIWPPNLEAFLFDGMATATRYLFLYLIESKALMDVPHMGRHKYTLNGKPHGRNELISLYIQIAYKNSLPPGEAPDPRMSRDRKQVSSHIQVLKNLVEKQAYKPCEILPQN
ncbi:hypothetical protein K3495_g5550 [Podosphaera aphanis]|nr:hypothetical protein K3495_g5550 [Podosphaera aphanis]